MHIFRNKLVIIRWNIMREPFAFKERLSSRMTWKNPFQTKAKISISNKSQNININSISMFLYFFNLDLTFFGKNGRFLFMLANAFWLPFFLFMSNWPNFLIWWCQCMLLVFFNTIHFLMIQRLRNQGSKSLSSWTYFPYDLEWAREAPKGG